MDRALLQAGHEQQGTLVSTEAPATCPSMVQGQEKAQSQLLRGRGQTSGRTHSWVLSLTVTLSPLNTHA